MNVTHLKLIFHNIALFPFLPHETQKQDDSPQLGGGSPLQVTLSQAEGAHAFNFNTQEGGKGRQISDLQSKFQDSQGYTMKPCLKKT